MMIIIIVTHGLDCTDFSFVFICSLINAPYSILLISLCPSFDKMC
jgi:hypothetical protein